MTTLTDEEKSERKEEAKAARLAKAKAKRRAKIAEKYTVLEQQVASIISADRGADPEEPITIGRPDGPATSHEFAWEGYVPLAKKVIAVVQG